MENLTKNDDEDLQLEKRIEDFSLDLWEVFIILYEQHYYLLNLTGT